MHKLSIEKISSFKGHTDCVYTLSPSSESKHFYSAGGDGQVVYWNLDHPEEGKVIAKVDSSVYALCYDHKRQWLVIGQNFEGIHIVDTINNSLVKSIKLTKAAIFDVKIADNHLFIACGNGEVIVLELINFTTIAKLKLSDKSARSLIVVGADIYIGFSDHHIRKINLSDFTLQKEWKAHNNSVFSLAYITKEQQILSAGRDAHLRSWDMSQQVVDSIPAHMYAINHLSLSPDQSLLASCSMDKAIKLWDSKTKELLKVIDKRKHPSHGTSINRLLWKSENILLSCSDDRSITAWKINKETQFKKNN